MLDFLPEEVAEAAVGVGHHAQAVPEQLAQLVALGFVALGPAVDEDHHGALALVGLVQFDVFTVGVLASFDVTHEKRNNGERWELECLIGKRL